MTARRQRSLVALGFVAVTGCSTTRVVDPHAAALAFAAATARGDAKAVYDWLSPAARAALSPADVARLLRDERAELAAEAREVSSLDARAFATARLRFADGEEVGLEWSKGRFAIASGASVPGGAPTPEAALDDLRRALARRSYPALLRLLSPATRSAIEQDLRTLVVGLEHPETLDLHEKGDAASAVVPGGHRVSLRREAGVWRVEDFD